jgi:hypothetical protein
MPHVLDQLASATENEITVQSALQLLEAVEGKRSSGFAILSSTVTPQAR